MNLRGRPGRWARRVTAATVAGVGVVNLARAVSAAPRRTGGLSTFGELATLVVGTRYVLVSAGLAALLAAPSLLRGKRAAWWIAVVAVTCSVPAHHSTSGARAALAVSAGALLTLLAFRSGFAARPDPLLARRAVAVLFGGAVVVTGYAAAGLYWLDTAFRRPVTAGAALHDAVRLLFLLPVSVEPITPHARWFVGSVRVAALAVVLLGVGWLVASVVGRPGHARDQAAVRRLLGRYATTGLAHFHLLDDKSWLLAADGEAFIGYRVVGTTAVALGEPIGRPASVRSVATDFLDLCALNGWTPVFHQVTEAGRDMLAALGWRALKVGEEAIVDLSGFTDAGPRFKSVRSAVRRCQRAGYRVVDLPHPLDDASLRRLRAVSDAWLAAGGHRERTFTLGRFDPDYLRTTPVVAAVDAAGEVIAFANVLPRYRSPNASFDLMRRRPDAVNGVMDLLFLGLIERFRADGAAGMNLGLAPLTGVGGPDDGLPGRVMRVLYAHGEAAFHFAGLRAFKDKWQPRWEPRYLVHRTSADLPRAATAVVRAGELPDPRRWRSRAAGVLRRYPVTAVFLALQAWIMTVTALHPALHTDLVGRFGESWPDLTRGQLWRLLTAPLIQSSPGFVWSNLVLLLVVLPLAERRLGSRRVPVLFVAGDWVATLPLLVGLRIAAAHGVGPAARLIAERDAGSSAGAWALAAAVVWTALPAGRARRIGATTLLVGLGAVALTVGGLSGVQHLIAAGAVVVACAAHARRRVSTGGTAEATGDGPPSAGAGRRRRAA